jgi:hypothetical protein
LTHGEFRKTNEIFVYYSFFKERKTQCFLFMLDLSTKNNNGLSENFVRNETIDQFVLGFEIFNFGLAVKPSKRLYV